MRELTVTLRQNIAMDCAGHSTYLLNSFLFEVAMYIHCNCNEKYFVNSI